MTTTRRYQDMAKRIQAAIKESGKSMNRWAVDAGLSPQTLSAFLIGLESGARRSANLETVETIAKAIGCTVGDLLGEERPREAPVGESWPELQAAVLYNPDRWHSDTIAAFRQLSAYRGKGLSPRELEKDLDELDKVVRQFLADGERATRQSRKK